MVEQAPIVTITTDFGFSDPYLGMMRGVMLQINPALRFVELSCNVGTFSVLEGAFALNFAYRCFPKGSIHLVVVDPGVGSARKPLLVSSADYHFIAPDNGILSLVYAGEKRCQVREIANPEYFRHPVSDTFHGRDIFGPAAAWLSRGVEPERFGPLLSEYVRIEVPSPSFAGGVLRGRVMYVDRFGNLITNIDRQCWERCRRQGGRGDFYLQLGGVGVGRLVNSYQGLSGKGEPFMLFGGTGYLEVALCRQRADEALGCTVGEPVRIVFS